MIVYIGLYIYDYDYDYMTIWTREY